MEPVQEGKRKLVPGVGPQHKVAALCPETKHVIEEDPLGPSWDRPPSCPLPASGLQKSFSLPGLP